MCEICVLDLFGLFWLRTIRYAVVPQVMPHFVSYTLLRFEINIRTASGIGFVGAGGIGQELIFVIRQFIYTDVSAIVLIGRPLHCCYLFRPLLSVADGLF